MERAAKAHLLDPTDVAGALSEPAQAGASLASQVVIFLVPPAPHVATEPVAPPAVAVPSENHAGSQEKKNETKPENPPN